MYNYLDVFADCMQAIRSNSAGYGGYIVFRVTVYTLKHWLRTVTRSVLVVVEFQHRIRFYNVGYVVLFEFAAVGVEYLAEKEIKVVGLDYNAFDGLEIDTLTIKGNARKPWFPYTTESHKTRRRRSTQTRLNITAPYLWFFSYKHLVIFVVNSVLQAGWPTQASWTAQTYSLIGIAKFTTAIFFPSPPYLWFFSYKHLVIFVVNSVLQAVQHNAATMF